MIRLTLVFVTVLFFAGHESAPADAPPKRDGISWFHDEAQARAEARKTGRPLLIDFSAAWCAACKMLALHTWSNPAVQREVAARFVPLELDVTDQTDAQQQMMRKYGVADLPTVLLMQADRPPPKEGPKRISGYVPPKEMLTRMRILRQ